MTNVESFRVYDQFLAFIFVLSGASASVLALITHASAIIYNSELKPGLGSILPIFFFINYPIIKNTANHAVHNQLLCRGICKKRYFLTSSLTTSLIAIVTIRSRLKNNRT